ncbi:hypothetical protein GOODEAATRI_009866, partial [Goodea atripinnis]
NPSQESLLLSISGSGSLHSWNLETTEELSDRTEDSDWHCLDTSLLEEEGAECLLVASDSMSPYIRRSSLGNGRGRLGLSGTFALDCFFSSALGLYFPSIFLFFRMTHSRSSRAKVSRENKLKTDADIAGGIDTCIA